MLKVSGLEKTSLTVGAVPVADEAGLYYRQGRRAIRAGGGLHVTIDSIVSSADATTGQNDGQLDMTAGISVLEEHGLARPGRRQPPPTCARSGSSPRSPQDGCWWDKTVN